jgi:tetratricopeptide (TPR) repeat protein
MAGPAFCTNCGKPLIPGAKFCAFCGTGIAAAAAAPVAAASALVKESSIAAGKTAEEWKAEGDTFYDDENYAEAVRCYNEAVKLDPDNETVKTKLMEKADELLRSGGSAQDPAAKKAAAAIDIYTSIIEQDESYPHVWTRRGLAKILGVRYFDAEYLDDETFSNYKVALPDLDRAIEEDEEDGNAYAYRAEIRWRCGRNDDALEDLQQAFDLSAGGWVVTAGEMYDDGVELPEEILDGLREEGYIDSANEDGEDEEDE